MRIVGLVVAALVAGAAAGAVSPVLALCMGDGEYEQALAEAEAREAAGGPATSDTPAVADAAPDAGPARDIEVAKVATPAAGAN